MKSQQFKPIAILGAGAWGTALSIYLAKRGQEVRLWSIEKSEIDAMLADQSNQRYLPGFHFPDSIIPTANLAEAIANVEDVIVVVPSVGYRSTLTLLKPYIRKPIRIINATKGADAKTGLLLNKVVEEVLGRKQKFAVISGPSFAKEVAAGFPTAIVAASRDKKLVTDIVKRFDSSEFRVQKSNDVIGVELGGIVKNVMAIATGISDGLNFGANTRSALLSYGLAEMTALGVKLKAKRETFIGLAGLGDLVLTCLDDQSRNRRFGIAIGKGKNCEEAERELGHVVEGKQNAELVVRMAKKNKVTMPICEAVFGVLQGKWDGKIAIEKMLKG